MVKMHFYILPDILVRVREIMPTKNVKWVYLYESDEILKDTLWNKLNIKIEILSVYKSKHFFKDKMLFLFFRF